MPVTSTLPGLLVGVDVVLLELRLVAALGGAAGEALLEGLGGGDREEGEDEGGEELHCELLLRLRLLEGESGGEREGES